MVAMRLKLLALVTCGTQNEKMFVDARCAVRLLLISYLTCPVW